MRTALSLILLAALAAGAAFGQQVVSAKSGMIHYPLGDVMLDGKLVEVKVGQYPQMKDDSVLSTGDGLVEVLLGPSAVLRMGENSAFKLISSRLSDTRIELLKGSLLVEVMETTEDAALTLLGAGGVISIEKPGVYRLDADPPALKVYDGQAAVERAGETLTVKKSRMLALTGAAGPEKFDNQVGDSLYRWAKRRAEALAMANVSAAKYARDNRVWLSSGWFYNPYFGMFTYVPFGRACNSFWGYRYWSPSTVYVVYERPRVPSSGGSGFDSGWHNTAGGYRSMPSTSSGYSGVASSAASSPSVSSAPAPAASGAASSHAPAAGGGGGSARGR